jgi:DTW domain-containing protein YfiP
LRAFDPGISFVILIHKIESRRRIATGRMSHLLLKDSRLIEGDCFENHPVVESLIQNEKFFPVVLYPGKGALDISKQSLEEQAQLVPANRRLLVFVIDGTWATARRTMRLSQNLARLPRVCFSPTRLSQFKVRKQPAAHCVSTIEAIHQTIELLGASQGFNIAGRSHDHMLEVFSGMVERQSAYLPA